MMMYVQDYDETYPLAFGKQGNKWTWDTEITTPPDWKAGDIGYRQVAWANSVQPYIKNLQIDACPSSPELRRDLVPYNKALKPWADVAYTYNGLLMDYQEAGINAPAMLPMIWEGHGKVSIAGLSLANPALICDDAGPCRYVPFPNTADGSCAPGNGGMSGMFNPDGTMWIHTGGANFVLSDGHAKWRRLGATTDPPNATEPTPTDYRTDPYLGYDSNGFPGYYWTDSGQCHAWLFRPDYDFQL
jgi:prepilin-type processing-associated H-X9-DG protein